MSKYIFIHLKVLDTLIDYFVYNNLCIYIKETTSTEVPILIL